MMARLAPPCQNATPERFMPRAQSETSVLHRAGGEASWPDPLHPPKAPGFIGLVKGSLVIGLRSRKNSIGGGGGRSPEAVRARGRTGPQQTCRHPFTLYTHSGDGLHHARSREPPSSRTTSRTEQRYGCEWHPKSVKQSTQGAIPSTAQEGGRPRPLWQRGEGWQPCSRLGGGARPPSSHTWTS